MTARNVVSKRHARTRESVLTLKLVFSSHIWKILSKATPLTLEVGERGCTVACAAEMDAGDGSMVLKGTLDVV